MLQGIFARLCRAGSLGMVLLAAVDAAILGHAWLDFATQRADAFEGDWPTFSRALTLGDAQARGLFAAIAGAALCAGGVALAVMFRQLFGQHPRARRLLAAKSALAVAAAGLGVVHYFHIVVTISLNNDLHMLLSYTFFFGMSGIILADLWLSARLEGPALADRCAGARKRSGVALLWVCALFLSTYVLKDLPGNPWPVATQRVFVVAETAWIVLAHLYALLYVPAARAHFAARAGALAAARKAAA